jgi:hypothetical protein
MIHTHTLIHPNRDAWSIMAYLLSASATKSRIIFVHTPLFVTSVKTPCRFFIGSPKRRQVRQETTNYLDRCRGGVWPLSSFPLDIQMHC